MILENLLQRDLDEIKKGYYFDNNSGVYHCLICQRNFEEGEIYPMKGRFFEARKAISFHIREEHGYMLELLLELDKKYSGITDNQKSILKDFYNKLSDKEIAKNNGISPATVRHQRFSFREKAKQAKAFLAIFELVEEASSNSAKEDFVQLHSGATMVDERYVVTNSEQEQIINSYFESLEPLKLKAFPTKEKRKIVVLRKIVTLFDNSKKYSEKEVNEIIKPVFADIATIRRYLVEYGFMDRTTDCKEYWLKI